VRKELQDLGVAVASYPRLVTSAAIMGMRSALSVLKQSVEEGRVIERPDLAVAFAEIDDLMGLGTIREMEQRFLTPRQLEAKNGAKQG
jgi:2-methylisocitrate lyase-like PEP mutase family enzyme